MSQVGLVWKLMCIGVSSEPLAKSKSFSGSQQWVSFETYFTVPEEGCGTQIIRLEVDAKADLDAQISGQAQFDNLVIARKK